MDYFGSAAASQCFSKRPVLNQHPRAESSAGSPDPAEKHDRRSAVWLGRETGHNTGAF